MSRIRVKLHSIGKNIQSLREKNGITQESFADIMNVSLDTIKNWEQHYNYPKIETLLEIANYFDCDVDYILGQQDTPRKQYSHIAKETGLSYEAVKTLAAPLNKHNLRYEKIISKLLEQEDLLAEIANCCEIDYSSIPSRAQYFCGVHGVTQSTNVTITPSIIQQANEMLLYNSLLKFIAAQRSER